MVSRIVKSSRKWSLAVFAVLVAGAAYLTLDSKPEPAKAQGGGTTSALATIPNPPAVTGGSTISMAMAFSTAGPTAPKRCYNRLAAPVCPGPPSTPGGGHGSPSGGGGGGCGTGKCGGSTSPAPTAHGAPTGLISGGGAFVPTTSTGSTMGTSTAIAALGRYGAPGSMTSVGNSVIDNQTLNYIHYAWDWPATNGLRIERIHRYRDMDRQSSFGPGVFSNFDAQLRIFDVGTASNPLPVVEVFDPLAMAARRMVPAIPGNHSRFVDSKVSNTYQYNTTYRFHDATSQSHAYRELRMFDAAGQPTTVDHTQAVAAELVLHSGDVFHFEILQAGSEFIDIDTGEAFLQPRDGRLVAIRDHTNRGMTISYKSWTAAEIQESPDRQWQIDTITDAHGVSAQFHYGETQIATRWAVSQIDLPNGESVSYTYENDQITAVNHPDGSQSTFAYGWEPVSQTTSLTFFDPSAEGTHRTKQVFLSNNLVDVDDLIFTSSSNLVRVVANGDAEVTYMNFEPTSGSTQIYVYEGSGKVFYATGGQHWSDGWDINEPAPILASTWGGNGIQTNSGSTTNQLEANPAIWGNNNANLNFSTGAPLYTVDEQGVYKSYSYTPDNAALASVAYADGSTESYARDSEDRVTMYTDRLGRSRQFTYDDRGNLTKLDLFKWTAADDFYDDYWDGDDTYGDYGQEDYTENNIQATWNWEYFPAGHVNEFMLAAFIDANGNRTDYEYDGNHRISKVIEPPDFEGDPRATTDYTWDAIGRLTAISDPSGSVRQFEYDNRNRLIKTTYSDGTSERRFYGTGADANLVVRSKDRRGVLTDYEYDATGRVTKTILAAGNMDESGSEFPLSSPTVTVENTVEYLNGTELPATTVSAGSKTDYTYDYKHRLVAKSVYPNTETTLTTHNVYVDNRKLYEQDAYGRRKYFGYDNSSGRMIRTIQATVPEFVPDGNSAYFDGDAFAATYLGDGTTFQQLLDYLEQDGGVTGEEEYGMYFGINDIIMSHVRKPDPDVNGQAIIKDIVHDQVGQILQKVDGRNTITKYTFDASMEAVAVELAYGTEVSALTETTYDAQGNILEVRNPRYFDPDDQFGYQKCRTVMAYTGRGLLANRTETPDSAESASESFTYDLARRQTTRTDVRGHQWSTQYPDCCGRTMIETNPLGHGTITHRDSAGHVIHEIQVADVASHNDTNDPNGEATQKEVTFRYDELGRVVASTIWNTPLASTDINVPPIAGLDSVPREDGATQQTIYDNNLSDGIGLDGPNVHMVSTGDGHSFSVTLNDALAKLAEPIGNGGASVQFDTSSSASAIVTINAENEVTYEIADSINRTIMTGVIDRVDNSLAQWASTVHDMTHISNIGTLLEEVTIDALGESTRSRTDGGFRFLESVDQLGMLTRTAYDSANNAIVIRDPNDSGSDIVFDGRNRPVLQTFTGSESMQSIYDAAGNLLSTTDGKGKHTNATYNARMHRIARTDRFGNTSHFEYDESGNLTALVDPESNRTEFSYNSVGQRILEKYPDHLENTVIGSPEYGIVTYQYHPSGLLASKTDQQGDMTRYQYDMAGRMIAREYIGHQSGPLSARSNIDSFTYDRVGRMLTAVKGEYGNVVTFTHDNSGRLATESLTIGGSTYSTGIVYDQTGAIVGYLYPDGTVVSRSYTARRELEAVSFNDEICSTRSYDGGGRVTSIDFGNGIEEVRIWNPDDTLNAIGVSGGDIEDRTYAWDENKNKISESISGAMAPFSFDSSYDAEDRLIQWDTSGPLGNRSWSLSPTGNWIAYTKGATVEARAHGSTHEMTFVDGNSVEYDAKGNVSVVPAVLRDSSNPVTIEWDFDNKLITGDTNNDGIAEVAYIYDALGRRVGRTASEQTTVFVQRGQQTIADYALGADSSSPDYLYLYGSYIDELIVRISPLDKLYYHSNQQYSTVAVSDAAGNIVERFAYGAYGRPYFLDQNRQLIEGSAHQVRHLFTGRDWDPAIGLFYYRARLYDPFAGRFCSRDPIGYEAGLLLYGYVDGAPLHLLDPTGLDALDNSANYAAGIADSLTMGIHGWVRGWIGINDGIDTDSGWYIAGEATEIAVEVTITLGAAASRHVARRTVREVVEAGARTAYRRKHNIRGGIIHHINPIKGHIGGKPSYFPLPYKWAARGAWNFQYVSNVAQHAAMHRRLRRLENGLRIFNMTQPVRNGGNLIIQHVLDNQAPPAPNNVTLLPEVKTIVTFSGEKTLYYDSCEPKPNDFGYGASGASRYSGTRMFRPRVTVVPGS